MSRRPFFKRNRFTGPPLCVESFYPSRAAYLCSEPGRSTPSPFLDLKDFPDHEAITGLLQEAGELEQEFDVIGRELRLFDAWDQHRDMWYAAFSAALKFREKTEAA